MNFIKLTCAAVMLIGETSAVKTSKLSHQLKRSSNVHAMKAESSLVLNHKLLSGQKSHKNLVAVPSATKNVMVAHQNSSSYNSTYDPYSTESYGPYDTYGYNNSNDTYGDSYDTYGDSYDIYGYNSSNDTYGSYDSYDSYDPYYDNNGTYNNYDSYGSDPYGSYDPYGNGTNGTNGTDAYPSQDDIINDIMNDLDTDYNGKIDMGEFQSFLDKEMSKQKSQMGEYMNNTISQQDEWVAQLQGWKKDITKQIKNLKKDRMDLKKQIKGVEKQTKQIHKQFDEQLESLDQMSKVMWEQFKTISGGKDYVTKEDLEAHIDMLK